MWISNERGSCRHQCQCAQDEDGWHGNRLTAAVREARKDQSVLMEKKRKPVFTQYWVKFVFQWTLWMYSTFFIISRTLILFLPLVRALARTGYIDANCSSRRWERERREREDEEERRRVINALKFLSCEFLSGGHQHFFVNMPLSLAAVCQTSLRWSLSLISPLSFSVSSSLSVQWGWPNTENSNEEEHTEGTEINGPLNHDKRHEMHWSGVKILWDSD